MDILFEVKRNNLLELKKYLQYSSLNVQDEFGRGLLHYAVLGKAIDCINVLIDYDIDIDLKDSNGQSPLFDAAIKGRLGIIKILIRNKANANIKDCFGNVALFYAIKTNNQAVVDFLTDNTDLTLVNNKQENALLKSIKFNYHDVEKFDDGNIHYNHINDSILHYAVKYNNLKLVKKYANRFLINQKNNNDESVFFYAVKFGNRDIVRELLQYLPVVDITNKYSENLIDVSVNNHYEISDLIENYLSSLDFIYYKKNHSHIYKYLCDNIIDKAITNKILNKKDNFSLSLIDYLNFYEDKPNLKMLDKNKNNRN